MKSPWRNHRRRERVTANGIRIVIDGEPHYYRGEATAALIGREVLVWHDVEGAPDFVTITDLERRNPAIVPRVAKLPAISATAKELNAAHAQAQAHTAYVKTLYRIIRPGFERSMFQPVLTDAVTVELGEQIAAQREAVQGEQQRRKEIQRKIQTHSRELGIRTLQATGNLDRKARGLEMLRQAQERDRQKEDHAL